MTRTCEQFKGGRYVVDMHRYNPELCGGAPLVTQARHLIGRGAFAMWHLAWDLAASSSMKKHPPVKADFTNQSAASLGSSEA